MTKKKWAGLAILLAVAAAAFALDHLGRRQMPHRFIIPFNSGLEMAPEAAGTLDLVAARMAENSDYRALVKGHTGTRGDPEVNHDLSRRRAELVQSELTRKGIEEDRIETFALGGQAPLKQLPDEGDRSHTRRLRRVEVTLKAP